MVILLLTASSRNRWKRETDSAISVGPIWTTSVECSGCICVALSVSRPNATEAEKGEEEGAFSFYYFQTTARDGTAFCGTSGEALGSAVVRFPDLRTIQSRAGGFRALSRSPIN